MIKNRTFLFKLEHHTVILVLIDRTHTHKLTQTNKQTQTGISRYDQITRISA